MTRSSRKLGFIILIVASLLWVFSLTSAADSRSFNLESERPVYPVQTEIEESQIDSVFGLSFLLPEGWQIFTEEAGEDREQLALHSETGGDVYIFEMQPYTSPAAWLEANQSSFHAWMTEITTLTIQDHPALIIGQPESCETAPMLIAAITRAEVTTIVKYYGGSIPDAAAFRGILSTLQFTQEAPAASDLSNLSTAGFPPLTDLTVCAVSRIAATEATRPRARKCPDAPMYIPTEGTLATPWKCFGAGCGPYNSNGAGYFAQGHRGLDIVGGQGAGVTPIYAPYDGTVRYYWNGGNQRFHYSLRLFYDAPYEGVASYLTHMGTDERSPSGKSLIIVPDGARVTGGVTLLGYQGYAGLAVRHSNNTHLHISWHKSSTGESNLSNTHDPTQYLRAKNLVYSSSWARSASPLTCITKPDAPPPPTSTDFFNEEFALSQTQADIEWWFPWYDHSTGRRDYIMIANPGPATAVVNIYVAGIKRTSAVSIPPRGEWHVRYEELIAGPVKIVSTNGQEIIATKRTLWNEPTPTEAPTLNTIASTTAPSLVAGEDEAATTWWSPWYDGDGKKNWVLVANPGPNYAQVELRIDGVKSPDSPVVIPAGEVWTPRYSGEKGGPLQVISLNQQPIMVSQRVLWSGDRSFNEVRGIPQSAASTSWYAPWYDATGNKLDAVHVVNPGYSPATINVYVGGVLQTANAVVPAQGEWHMKYPDLKGGPLTVVSTNGREIMVTQRVLWRVDTSPVTSFDETVAVPREQLDTQWWFPWYDNSSGHKNWILVGNPSNTAARIDVYVEGNKQNSAPITIVAGGVWTVRYPDLIGGPVRIVSTNGVKILASQRVLWDGETAFNEVMGMPQQVVALPNPGDSFSIGGIGIADANGTPLETVSQGEFLQFGSGATNQTGSWEQTNWSWTVTNAQGQTVPELSSENNPLFMATGNMGYTIGVVVPDDIAPGTYTLHGQIAKADGVSGDDMQMAFQVADTAEEYEIYLPMVVR